MRPIARIRETVSTQSTVSPIIDCETNSRGCFKRFFTALGIFGSKLISNTISDKKIIIQHLCVCEKHALISVTLLVHAPQGYATFLKGWISKDFLFFWRSIKFWKMKSFDSGGLKHQRELLWNKWIRYMKILMKEKNVISCFFFFILARLSTALIMILSWTNCLCAGYVVWFLNGFVLCCHIVESMYEWIAILKSLNPWLMVFHKDQYWVCWFS